MEQAPIVEVSVVRTPRFAPPDILWYFGGLAAAAAADGVVDQTSTASRGLWILLVGLAFMAVFAVLAAGLFRVGRRIPGGVLTAAAVLVVPYTEVGFERLFGVHPKLGTVHVDVSGDARSITQTGGDFHGALFAIALGTVVVGLAAYWLVRFAFVLLPAVVALAVAAELFLPAVVSHPSAGDAVATGLVTGLLFVVAGMLLDARGHRRDAFWWYVIGLFLVAVAFTYYIGARHHTWVWLLLLVVAACVLAASAPLGRATWAVYSLLGLYATLAHYIAKATGSWHSPFLLALVGLGLVLSGLVLETVGPTFVGRFTRPWPAARRD